jgi:hypothetical protein
MVADQEHREHAFVLDGELELQPLALIVGVAGKPCIGCWKTEVLFFTPFFRFFRGVVIKQPITFHHVQSLGVWLPNISTIPRKESRDPECGQTGFLSCDHLRLGGQLRVIRHRSMPMAMSGSTSSGRGPNCGTDVMGQFRTLALQKRSQRSVTYHILYGVLNF